MFLLELLLHCADISNPCKPFAICEKWSKLIAEEFARQGDREKKEGLEVSPMMDRDQIILNNMQLGFIEFVVSPLITSKLNIEII
jgi:cAMP-specific phosphodiesterase 4